MGTGWVQTKNYLMALRAFAFSGVYKHEIPGLTQALQCIGVGKVQVLDQARFVQVVGDGFRYAGI
jgi:hypothetical protein